MKTIYSFLLVVALLLSLTACGGESPADSSAPSAPANESSELSVPESESDSSEPIEDETTTTKKSDQTTTTETVETSITTEAESTTTTRQRTRSTTRRSVRSTKVRTTETPETTTTTEPTTTTSKIEDDMIIWETPNTDYHSKYADYIQYRTPLTNSYNKLTKNKKLKVMYIGGSLTNGSGVSENLRDQESWRGLTGQWLEETFPKANITNINMAVGSTGSELGVYRLEQNVIAQNPDLLFVEFAINDQYYSNNNKLKPRASFETLIRETRQNLPYCDIVVLITADRNCAQQYYGTSAYPHSTAIAHMELAQAYGLSVINIAQAFVDEVAELTDNKKWFNDTKLWSKYINDNVHPNADGYAMWFNYVKEYLENSLLNTDYSTCKITARKVPAVQSVYLLDGNRQAYIGSEIQKQVLKSDGTFTYVKEQASKQSGYCALERGGTVTLKFTGTECAIWTNFEQVEFKISYTIDGKDTYTMENKWSDPYYLVKNLEPGEHTVEITHCEDSKLRNFNLIGFFMRDATQQTTR